jgi:nicotinate dehydrogenase subunit B
MGCRCLASHAPFSLQSTEGRGQYSEWPASGTSRRRNQRPDQAALSRPFARLRDASLGYIWENRWCEEGAANQPAGDVEQAGAFVAGQKAGNESDAERARALGALAKHPRLDDWVAFAPGQRVIIRSGKVELGQGIRTALTLVAAEELRLDAGDIDVARPTTGLTPEEGNTAGSHSVQHSCVAVRQACAHAYRILMERAAAKLDEPAESLSAAGGVITDRAGHQVSYWDLAEGRPFDTLITEVAPLQSPAAYRWIGRGTARVDLAAKISGEPVFVQDLRLPGMVFARVVRPRRLGARLSSDLPATFGGARVIRAGDFVAVVAGSEGAAAAAASSLRPLITWAGGAPFSPHSAEPDHLTAHVVVSHPIVNGKAVIEGGSEHPEPGQVAPAMLSARYTRPFLLHGSIGPSGAVAHLDDGRLTVWSHSQGIGILRKAIAHVLGMEAGQVSVRHMDGSGCYGHNGADDVALDAALVAAALPGEPVSLRWTRDDEHGFEPLGAAMVVDVAGGIGADGTILSWREDIYTYPHATRPSARPVAGQSGLLASWALDPPFTRPTAAISTGFESGGHRNGTPGYLIGDLSVIEHGVDDGTPVRTSALRSLGALANVFAIESFMDEVAAAAGQDPAALRLRHLGDERGRAVIETVLEMAGGLQAAGGDDAPGRGVGYAHYENSMTYAAMVVELTVDAETGEVRLRKAWIAADAGEVIDPDGLTNQLEGGFIQAASWALYEAVTLDSDGVSSRDWESYPIMRFDQVPEIETRLLDRPGYPPLGAGEASCGPAAAAIGNAIAQYTGARVRDLPLSPARIMAAFSELL